MSSVLVVGGSGGLGREIARYYASRGDSVVVTSRSAERAEAAAREIGGDTRGVAVDLAEPETIDRALADVGELDHLVITAIEQYGNTVKEFSITDAVKASTVKLVGYTEVARVLHDRLRPGASIVLFGGLGKLRPYPGSTMITATNGAVSGVMRTLAVELAPIRVNALHPGIVGDSPAWADRDQSYVAGRTPTGRATTMAEVVDATDFLLRNGAANAIDLHLDGGIRVA
ncbi:SDR family oxidoreductase [Kribbella sp. CA-293567]|uniref:SDR family oxidoreductase n=1 Tax=Kribbella sp. CA-293567 TaxID=3002436 RepID=UPI0022DD93A2|nr:SDR family oxidoreductase [Kribbella sp. CA-293567]WBQ05766.1 SDR family oxidoreductase [Kribbella sp. CA-293567]